MIAQNMNHKDNYKKLQKKIKDIGESLFINT